MSTDILSQEIIRLLQWKIQNGVTDKAFNTLPVATNQSLPSYFRAISKLQSIVPFVTCEEYTCCPNMCFTDTDELGSLECPECGFDLYNTRSHANGSVQKKPLAVYSYFPLSPRLACQWKSVKRSTELKYRINESRADYEGNVHDYIQAEFYRNLWNNGECRSPYEHMLAFLLDGFSIFKRYVKINIY